MLALAASIACSNDEGSPPVTPAPVASVDVSQYRERLGADLWARAGGAAWLDGDKATPDGARLLEVLAGGRLVTAERKLELLGAYPEGLTEDRLAVANRYATWIIGNVHDVLVAPWILDGIDGYERAVLDAAGERTISPSALKLAIDRRVFEDLYESDPELLTSRRIDALGSLDPAILARVEQEAWFQDGLDDYDVSLLGILADMIQVEDAIEVLDEHTYRPLPLGDTTLAVVLLGDSDRLKNTGFDLVLKWMQEVEDFAGAFQSIGLIIDVTPVPGDQFCHGSGGSEYSVGYVAFTSDGCFYDEVVVHELSHAFIGGRFPAWFTEGVAEMVTYDVLGEPAGYGGGFGLIEPEGYYFVGSGAYLNQASLGTDFLTELYDLAGPEAMAKFTRELAGQRLTGQNVLARIRAIPGTNRAALEELVTHYFGATGATGANGLPVATPSPTSR
jgi:hypothetical protein